MELSRIRGLPRRYVKHIKGPCRQEDTIEMVLAALAEGMFYLRMFRCRENHACKMPENLSNVI